MKLEEPGWIIHQIDKLQQFFACLLEKGFTAMTTAKLHVSRLRILAKLIQG